MVDAEAKAQVDKMRKQLEARQGDEARVCLIHPIESRFLPWWDLCTTLALIFTATVTPWETAFASFDYSANPWIQPWFVINRVVDLIFLVDVCFALRSGAMALASYFSTAAAVAAD